MGGSMASISILGGAVVVVTGYMHEYTYTYMYYIISYIIILLKDINK